MIEVTLFASDIWSAGLEVNEKCRASSSEPTVAVALIFNWHAVTEHLVFKFTLQIEL